MKKAVTLLILLTVAACMQAQDVHFSQFYKTPLLRNPALAGIFTGKFRAYTVYRNQWAGVNDSYSSSSPYTTMALGIECKLLGYCLGDNTLTGGVQIVKDYAGAGKLNRVMSLFNIAYRGSLSDNIQVAGGLYGGPVISNFDFSKFSWDDQYVNGRYSPTNPSGQPIPFNTKTYGDFGGGIALRGEGALYQWYTGTSLYHVNRPKTSFSEIDDSLIAYRQKMRATINGGLAFLINDFDYLKFYADVMFQSTQREYMIGALYKKRLDIDTEVEDEGFCLTAGLLYRYNDAVIPVINIQAGKWAIGMSYDANVSRLTYASKMRGGIEFTLKYRGLLQGQSCDQSGCEHSNKSYSWE